MTDGRTLHLSHRAIGDDHPAFIAAEIGINHNGDLELAKSMIDAAADSGADGVKFQNYRTEDFIADRSLTWSYENGGKTVIESQFDMFKRYEMPEWWIPELKNHCDMRSVEFFSTPTSSAGIDVLVRHGVGVMKNGSDFLGHVELVRSFARSGLPTVLSTGMAVQDEIDDAVSAYRGAGGDKLVLLHCTSSYPTPMSEVNLRRMLSIRDRYECLVGFSDHTAGHESAVAAVVMGAVFIEKHFTLDAALPGPDHSFSATPSVFRDLVQGVRDVECALGAAGIQCGESEAGNRDLCRLSCRASKDLSEGAVLSEADVCLARPSDGLPPAAICDLVGATLSRALSAGDPIDSSCIAGDVA
ncbi:MAG: N-acetylneuraminate synthase family protein [Phycisphaerales bacterium]|nr:N-acetylneuraminate synthase family protein [Phycisphaerales bacterium]